MLGRSASSNEFLQEEKITVTYVEAASIIGVTVTSTLNTRAMPERIPGFQGLAPDHTGCSVKRVSDGCLTVVDTIRWMGMSRHGCASYG
ncbi:hypothetical protein Pla52n_08590 [Stieleria varia]|uniref:Uncharacterized protein n=1 Tax=Stieleria varia TaxID=2528005 RepID=A0A5C6B978_9BACT|nr:hypothetical protein Pla52n_08590 [Stieleria varia]